MPSLLPEVLGASMLLRSFPETISGATSQLFTVHSARAFPSPRAANTGWGDHRQRPHAVRPQLQRQRRNRAVLRGTFPSQELLTQPFCHPMPQSSGLFPPVPQSSLGPTPEPQDMCSKYFVFS